MNKLFSRTSFSILTLVIGLLLSLITAGCAGSDDETATLIYKYDLSTASGRIEIPGIIDHICFSGDKDDFRLIVKMDKIVTVRGVPLETSFVEAIYYGSSNEVLAFGIDKIQLSSTRTFEVASPNICPKNEFNKYVLTELSPAQAAIRPSEQVKYSCKATFTGLIVGSDDLDDAIQADVTKSSTMTYTSQNEKVARPTKEKNVFEGVSNGSSIVKGEFSFLGDIFTDEATINVIEGKLVSIKIRPVDTKTLVDENNTVEIVSMYLPDDPDNSVCTLTEPYIKAGYAIQECQMAADAVYQLKDDSELIIKDIDADFELSGNNTLLFDQETKTIKATAKAQAGTQGTLTASYTDPITKTEISSTLVIDVNRVSIPETELVVDPAEAYADGIISFGANETATITQISVEPMIFDGEELKSIQENPEIITDDCELVSQAPEVVSVEKDEAGKWILRKKATIAPPVTILIKHHNCEDGTHSADN